MKLKGIDISEHNGNVNMNAIKNDGIEFVMIRSSYGRFYKDKQVDNNVRKCQEVGMPFGFYHYSYSRNYDEGVQEAKQFLELIRKYSGRTYPLCLDMEDADSWKVRNGVTDKGNIEVIQAFKDVIEGAGEYLTLYMNKSWFDRLKRLNNNLISSIDAWLAHWGISSPSMTCGMWQYTSDGKVNGSSARTDMNYCYVDYPSILATMKGEEKPSAPTETTPQGSVMDLATRVLANEFGAGEERKKALGNRWEEVQAEVDHRLLADVDTLVQEVLANRYGIDDERRNALGPRYDEVQSAVDAYYNRNKMSEVQFAKEVWYEGKHGTGETRKAECRKYGVNYNEVQRLLQILANGGTI